MLGPVSKISKFQAYAEIEPSLGAGDSKFDIDLYIIEGASGVHVYVEDFSLPDTTKAFNVYGQLVRVLRDFMILVGAGDTVATHKSFKQGRYFTDYKVKVDSALL